MICVIGLPRSRTTWFSALLSFGGFPCVHDWFSFNKEPHPEYNAYSDTLLHKHTEGSRTLVIHRPIKEVYNSLLDNFTFPEFVTEKDLIKPLEQQAEKMKLIVGMHVNYNELDDKLGEAWEYLTGEAPNNRYMKQMQSYRINVAYNDILDAEGALKWLV